MGVITLYKPATHRPRRNIRAYTLSPFSLHFCSSSFSVSLFTLPPPLICSPQHRLALSLIHSPISAEGGEIYNGLWWLKLLGRLSRYKSYMHIVDGDGVKCGFPHKCEVFYINFTEGWLPPIKHMIYDSERMIHACKCQIPADHYRKWEAENQQRKTVFMAA